MTPDYSYYLISNSPKRQRLCETLGRNVRRLRIEQGLSISELAVICEMGRPLISKIENGASDVRLSYVERLADALCVDPLQLFLDTGSSNPSKQPNDPITCPWGK